jgi:DNA adenine methylase
MGSKNRIARHILPIILKDRKEGQWYVEPFVGGANMIDKVEENRIGADCNEYLIEALKLIRDNITIIPKDNTETNELEYKFAKNSNNKALKGYYGFALSYGGKWFGGWRRDKKGKRDYVAEAYRSATKQSELLQGVEFVHSEYNELDIPNNSIIYCDPPYANTTKYKDSFNHDEFWEWCRVKSKEGHQVFISEYNAPDDFECVWQKEIVSSLTKNTGAKKGVEKLFIYKGECE